MEKIILWGTGNGSERILKTINKNQFNVVGYIDNDKNKHWKNFNEGLIYPPEEISNLDFDYIIIATQYEDEIENQISKLGIQEKKIIKGIVKRFDYDVKKYFDYYYKYNEKIGMKEFSIVSDSCWGGFLYKKISKEYTSPFIWTLIENDDYIKLLADLKYYLKQKPYFFTSSRYIDQYGKEYPVAKLGDVLITFPHASKADEAIQKWNRRVQRFNYDNIFIEMAIESREMAEKFNKLPYENKIGFTYEKYNLNSCVYTPTFLKEVEDVDVQKWYLHQFKSFLHAFSYKYFDSIAWVCNKNI